MMSHWGRPIKDIAKKPELTKADFSLSRIVAHLSSVLGKTVLFAEDALGEDAQQKAAALQAGEVLLLENLRYHKEEEKGDEAFAQSLAKLGDVYVNDAFGTAHRAHASTAVIAQCFGADKKMFEAAGRWLALSYIFRCTPYDGIFSWPQNSFLSGNAYRCRNKAGLAW